MICVSADRKIEGDESTVMKIRYKNERRMLVLSLTLIFVVEAAAPVLAKGGKKYFKEGIKFAENKQWDKAAERLALAVAEDPSNAEFQLHHHRALVNAAILLVDRADRLAAQKD